MFHTQAFWLRTLRLNPLKPFGSRGGVGQVHSCIMAHRQPSSATSLMISPPVDVLTCRRVHLPTRPPADAPACRRATSLR